MLWIRLSKEKLALSIHAENFGIHLLIAKFHIEQFYQRSIYCF